MLNLIFREFEIIQSYKFACEPAGNGRFQVWKVSEVKADFKFMYYKKKSPKLHFIKFCYRNFVAVICEVGWRVVEGEKGISSYRTRETMPLSEASGTVFLLRLVNCCEKLLKKLQQKAPD